MTTFIQHRSCCFLLPTTDSTTTHAARSDREVDSARQSVFRGMSQKNWNFTNNYEGFVYENCLSANY
jgi:hypothetical protein